MKFDEQGGSAAPLGYAHGRIITIIKKLTVIGFMHSNIKKYIQVNQKIIWVWKHVLVEKKNIKIARMFDPKMRDQSEIYMTLCRLNL